ncbi:MAG TPA: methyl-accepting chemotaxis protein [Polyangiales bacterium]|jgi:methyl-accepting chemotaxis protein WspA|nr:methyl-accepting chemotaxis protein [Polyangiales bacterium]
MERFTNLSIAQKLACLSGVFLVGFAAFTAFAYQTLDRVKVNGEIYHNIVRNKDIVADVLPPPEYIVETYMITLRLTQVNDQAMARAWIDRARELHTEYDTRHAFWSKEPIQDDLKRALLVDSYKAAQKFFEVWEREFVPAVLANDHEKATQVAMGPLQELYEEHRHAIDDVVRLSTAYTESYEKFAAADVKNSTSHLFTLAGVIALLAIVLAWMIANSLMSRLRSSSVALMSTATQISATSKEQQTTVNDHSASTAEIAAAVKEISATSQELRSTLDGIADTAQRSAGVAEAGRESLGDMDQTMRHLADSTASISSKLSVIREKAGDINTVVTTITKVADQTNLLSVNAAIEAEKAGEYGLGFLVVAREIRRLADQSAVATLDIEQMVRHMQSAVSAGVMEMDKFAEEVRRGVTSVSSINAQLVEVIEQVQSLSSRIESVKDGMHSQAIGASQINDAMAHLTEGVRQTAASLKEFNSATDSLRDVVAGLRRELSKTAA